MSLFLSLFMWVVMGILIQQLCMLQMSKNGKLVDYFSTKDQAAEGNIWLPMQDTTNLKLVDFQTVNSTML